MRSIAAGSAHSAAIFDLKNIGPVVHVWGAGSMGQLGLRRLIKADAGVKTGGSSSGAGVPDAGDGEASKAHARQGSAAANSDSKTGVGDNREDYVDEEDVTLTSLCVPIPTKLNLDFQPDGELEAGL